MPFYELVCIARHNIVEVKKKRKYDFKRLHWLNWKDCVFFLNLSEQLERSFKDISKTSPQSRWCCQRF